MTSNPLPHPAGIEADETTAVTTASVVVIFGAGGDLAWRKLLPALFDLYMGGYLPEHFAVLGLDRKDSSPEAFRTRVIDGISTFARYREAEEAQKRAFAARLHYSSRDFSDAACYQSLKEQITGLESSWQEQANRLFYLATPPFLAELVVQGLSRAELETPRGYTRLVVEKPFGHDLGSAKALNRILLDVFEESQIYRIDHYLGKETVQNLLAFRFANALFEPLWDRRYIDHVQISVTESVGVGHRGGYYEGAGALRDMLQNHLLQLLCLVAMEAPVSFEADEIRDKKIDVLRALRPLDPGEVARRTVRGQYIRGQLDGASVPAYRDEPGVDPQSATETYAALKLFVDNWRWHGVPFYLRSGKRLKRRDSEIAVVFKDVPHRAFPKDASKHWPPNCIVIHVQPDEGVAIHMQAKRPGLQLRLEDVKVHYTYQEAFSDASPEAYETLLRDALLGDATLFMRADQVELAWSALMPAITAWEEDANSLSFYEAGSWGPKEAETLVTRSGRRWLDPTTLSRSEPES